VIDKGFNKNIRILCQRLTSTDLANPCLEFNASDANIIGQIAAGKDRTILVSNLNGSEKYLIENRSSQRQRDHYEGTINVKVFQTIQSILH